MAHLTALSDLPRTLNEGSTIAWQFEPSLSVDQDAIGLHVARAERTAKIFGLGGS